MRYVYLAFALTVVLVVSIAGFRGSPFTKPPFEIFDDMDHQPKYKAQGPSRFFADGRTDRPLPPGVVPRGYLREDDHLYRGKNADGEWARGFPAALDVNEVLLDRGRERYVIYCAPCHGAIGDGNGITKLFGMVATPTYHDERIREMAEGEIFEVITNGRNTMEALADKLVPEDRWAVIAYVRALQRARQGSPADVPAARRAELGL